MASATRTVPKSPSSRTSRTARTKDRGASVAGVAAALAAAIILAVGVARLTIASAVADSDPALASRLAPRSPDALVSTAMAEVGQAAATGGDPRAGTIARLRRVGTVAPLQPEPFLVQAALAERAGDYSKAETLLRQARGYDPRSIAARYLLADVWLRQDRMLEGLSEMAILARLLPGASVQLVPALAQFARTPGARDKLAAILKSNPRLRRPLLDALASDPDNAGLILALAGPEMRSADADGQRWKSRLLDGLVKRGGYARAYGLWRNFAGLPDGTAPLLFNGDFRKLPAPAPFNWTFISGSAGIAEPAGGRLRILFYGRDDATLASQVLLLTPGDYAFEAPVSGTAAPESLAWTLTCIAGGKRIMQLDLAADRPAARFTVPAGCEAQKLELVGRGQDMPKDSDVQVGPAGIRRLGA